MKTNEMYERNQMRAKQRKIISLTMSFFAVVCGYSLIVDGKKSVAAVPTVFSEMKLTPKMMMIFVDSLGLLCCRPHVLVFHAQPNTTR